jgi:hypothetical protein
MPNPDRETLLRAAEYLRRYASHETWNADAIQESADALTALASRSPWREDAKVKSARSEAEGMMLARVAPSLKQVDASLDALCAAVSQCSAPTAWASRSPWKEDE